jgi:hypothetical protein
MLAPTVTPFRDTEPSWGLHCHVVSESSGRLEPTSLMGGLWLGTPRLELDTAVAEKEGLATVARLVAGVPR